MNRIFKGAYRVFRKMKKRFNLNVSLIAINSVVFLAGLIITVITRDTCFVRYALTAVLAIAAIWLSVETRVLRKQDFEKMAKPMFWPELRHSRMEDGKRDTLVFIVKNQSDSIAVNIWAYRYDREYYNYLEPADPNEQSCGKGDKATFLFKRGTGSIRNRQNVIDNICNGDKRKERKVRGFISTGEVDYLVLVYRSIFGRRFFEIVEINEFGPPVRFQKTVFTEL